MAAPARPPKQQSTNAPPTPKRKRAADTSNSPAMSEEPSSKKARLGESLNLPSQSEIAAANSMEGKYDVQLQNVISSSKIQNRVIAVLQHIGGGATPTSTSTSTSTTSDTKHKTKISVLRAKAADAGKLITIAEIAKRELEKEKDVTPTSVSTTTELRWFQYIALGEEIKERPRDQGKKKTTKDGDTAMDDDCDDDDDDDGDFETMKTPFERAIEKQPLIRGTPVMSLFLSRVPIEELKKKYGEQTNASPI